MNDLLYCDSTREYDNESRTRTLIFDLPAPWLVHGLFRSEAYVSHTTGQVTITVALATDDGYATGLIVLTAGLSREGRSFDDYFSGGPDRPADKATVTFRTDVTTPRP